MERKELAKKIAEHFDTKAKYLGPPTFAFEIKTPDETYTIDRQGSITTSTGEIMGVDEILSKSENEKEAVSETIKEDIADGIEVSIPIDNHSVAGLVNIINMISAKQELIKKAFGTTADFMDKDFARDLSKEKTDTLEEFIAAIKKLGDERCSGVTFGIDDTITFRLHGTGPDADKAKAFMELCAAITAYAKKLKHSSYKPSQDENPKYAMRTWLIRLGMIGDEYKQTRKIILSGLDGSGAYRREADTDAN